MTLPHSDGAVAEPVAWRWRWANKYYWKPLGMNASTEASRADFIRDQEKAGPVVVEALYLASPINPVPAGVGVKALEWRELPLGGYAAEPPLAGYYNVYPAQRGWIWTRNGGGNAPPYTQFATSDEAKAAAQADYEARIRSALRQAPDAEQGAVANGLEQPVSYDVRRGYFDTIEKLVSFVKAGTLTAEQKAEFDHLADEHSWDGLSCYCGGGWLVGHRSGCPEAPTQDR